MPLQLLNFAFNAGPGFHFNAYPDPASKNDADPGSATLLCRVSDPH